MTAPRGLAARFKCPSGKVSSGRICVEIDVGRVARQSQVPAVSRYVRDQKEHHKKFDFKEEFRALCRKYNAEIDERYCWD